MAIASNAAFFEWAHLHRPRICAVIIERFTFDTPIIETDSDFYRLHTTKQCRAARAS